MSALIISFTILIYIDPPHPFASQTIALIRCAQSRSSVSTLSSSSLPSPTHFNVKAGLSTSVQLSKGDQRRLQVLNSDEDTNGFSGV